MRTCLNLPLNMGSEALRGLQAAHICCPGATKSGLRTSAGFLWLSMISGPLEENLLTVGICLSKTAVLPSPMEALPPYLITHPRSVLLVCSS